MPITVEHGGRGGTAAGQIIAQAGMASLQRELQQAMQSERLNVQQAMQRRQIDAQAAGQARGAEFQAGLQDQRFGNELDMMRQRSAVESEQLGLELSTRDKQKQASSIAAENAIMNNPNFSDEHKVAAIKEIQLGRAGIGPTVQSDKPKYAPVEGQPTDPGMTWIQAGSLMGRKSTGDPFVIVREDQTWEYKKKVVEAAAAQGIIDTQAKKREQEGEWTRELLGEEGAIETVDPKNPALTISRRRTPDEVQKILNDYRKLDRKIQEGPGESVGVDEWWVEAEQQGLDVREEDLDMPPKAGQAQAILRTLEGKYGEAKFQDMSEQDQLLAEQAAAVLERFERYRKLQEKRGRRWR